MATRVSARFCDAVVRSLLPTMPGRSFTAVECPAKHRDSRTFCSRTTPQSQTWTCMRSGLERNMIQTRALAVLVAFASAVCPHENREQLRRRNCHAKARAAHVQALASSLSLASHVVYTITLCKMRAAAQDSTRPNTTHSSLSRACAHLELASNAAGRCPQLSLSLAVGMNPSHRPLRGGAPDPIVSGNLCGLALGLDSRPLGGPS